MYTPVDQSNETRQSIIGEPPVKKPSFHEKLITDADVTAGKLANPTGAEGTSTMIAPLPASDVGELRQNL